jgi:hypothetical protein
MYPFHRRKIKRSSMTLDGMNHGHESHEMHISLGVKHVTSFDHCYLYLDTKLCSYRSIFGTNNSGRRKYLITRFWLNHSHVY